MNKVVTFRTLLLLTKPSQYSLISARRLHLYLHHDLTFDIPTCISALQSCARYQNLQQGKQLHCYMLKDGLLLDSRSSVTSLINMYCKCNEFNYAANVFYSPLCDRNVFAYNALIAGFVGCGECEVGIELYREMRKRGVGPDKFTFPVVINAFRDLMDVLEVMKIHGTLFKLGLEMDVYVGSALVNCYLKLGLADQAEGVFEGFSVKEDVVLWNAMVSGYGNNRKFDKAFKVFRRMNCNGIMPCIFTVTGILSVCAEMGDFENGRAIHGLVMKMGYDLYVAVLNALIDMYGKCKGVEEAFSIFEMIEGADLYSWNSVISVQELCGKHDMTLKLFKRMLHGSIKPDLLTLTSVISACSELAALMHGREVHSYIIVSGLGKYGTCRVIDMVPVNNALLDMYAKCGSMRDALIVFNNMSTSDVASWNIIILGYGMQGYVNEALNFFVKMCGAEVQPDEVTFVSLLSACSHAGFLRQGRDFLAHMKSKYGIVPRIEHYTCVIDMLGRANQIEEAFEIARKLPIEATPVVWRALLAACQLHGNMDIAEIALQKILELDPTQCGSYILMSNAYVASSFFDKVSDVRYTMRQQNMKKIPGCSWIELKNGLHAFINGDRTHPEVETIYSEIHSLTARLFKHGYTPSLSK